MKTKLLSLLLTVAMLASATLIPISAAAEEVTPDATPVSDVDTSATEATPMPEETPLAEAEPEASPAPVVDAPAATVADESLFTYTVTDGKATITAVDPSISGNIIIPDTLGGYPVTSIGYEAFSGCTGLTSVIIPDSVTSIGMGAFYSCSSLALVTVESATIARNPSYGYLVDYAKTVLIPATITTVGSYVTSNFANRDSITMDGVLYTVYSKHSHADASVWNEDTCTLCGLYNPCRDGHDMQGAT